MNHSPGLKYTNLGILAPLMKPIKVSVIGFLLVMYTNFRINNVLVGRFSFPRTGHKRLAVTGTTELCPRKGLGENWHLVSVGTVFGIRIGSTSERGEYIN